MWPAQACQQRVLGTVCDSQLGGPHRHAPAAVGCKMLEHCRHCARAHSYDHMCHADWRLLLKHRSVSPAQVCLYCDAFEYSGQAMGAYGNGERGVHIAFEVGG